MRWLISVARTTSLDALGEAVRSAHGSVRDIDPVPMGPDELVVFVEGPADLPEGLDGADVPVLQVSPDSEPQPY